MAISREENRAIATPIATPSAPQDAPPRPHWHPKRSSRIGADGRIHALIGYRIHVEPMRANLRDARRLCDELICDACVHDCACLECSGWCLCDTPPEPTTYAQAPNTPATPD